MEAGPGLRERKKVATMRRVQQTALELFDRHGYEAVTVEQVADAAEVSASSVYRYFSTKERLVLWDEYDPEMLAVIDRALAQGGGLVEALRSTAATVMGAIRALGPSETERILRRMRYVITEPTVRSGMLRETEEAELAIRRALSAHTGAPEDSLELRVAVSQVLAAFLSAIFLWAEQDGATDLGDLIDRTIALLDHGPPLLHG